MLSMQSKHSMTVITTFCVLLFLYIVTLCLSICLKYIVSLDASDGKCHTILQNLSEKMFF